MSLANLDHLAGIPGILAVTHRTASTTESRGSDTMTGILAASVAIFHAADSPPHFRAMLGKHTIAVERWGEVTIAAVYVTGHAICKSIRRFIREAARRSGPPQSRQPRAAKMAANRDGVLHRILDDPPQPRPARPRRTRSNTAQAPDPVVVVDYDRPLPTVPTRPF